MCKVLVVSRSGYYASKHHQESLQSARRRELGAKIVTLWKESNKTYGSPRIQESLEAAGEKASRPFVAKLMKIKGIKGTCKRRYKTTTDSNHALPVSENHLNRRFKVEELGKAWVSDITYVPTAQGWLYLTTVIDLADRQVIGHAFSSGMKTSETTLPALRTAMDRRSVQAGALFHSDRGVQYAAQSFRNVLKANKFKQSMSRKGNCWDNAVAESFFKTLKQECANRYHFKTREEASLNYKTPAQREEQLKTVKVAA